jgi:hypothetical protein
MFRWARHRYKLFMLVRQERALDKEWKRKNAEAEERKEPAILEEWENSYGDLVYEDLRWSRNKLVSDELLREADELYLPRPQFDDATKWENKEDYYGMPRPGFVLTAAAMTELRASIRKEKKERREAFEWWIKLFGSLTGLVGALIGLVSIWRHK